MGARRVMGAVMTAWVMVGCGIAEPELAPGSSLETSQEQLVTGNGRGLNGRGLNGRGLNGETLNRSLVSVRYDGAKREGMSIPLDEVWLEGSVFHGLVDSEELSGTDFQQMRFVGNLSDGATVALRVDSVTPGMGALQDVWRYRVSYQEPTTGLWHPICTAADGTAVDAIPLEGRWDYSEGVAGGGAKLYDATTFTFACEGAALAKCVEFGYAPWRSVDGVSLAEHHQACTRLLRGDFCGDGTPHTVDGNWVNLYDAVSVQVDTEAWLSEAEWTPAGATCFTSTNRAPEPFQCADGRLVESCASSFSPGTLLISEIPGAQL